MSRPTSRSGEGYLAVFGALLVLTIVTVGVSYLHLPTTPAVASGSSIADGQGRARRVVLHAPQERAADGVLAAGLTGGLFVALIAFVLWTEADHLSGTIRMHFRHSGCEFDL